MSLASASDAGSAVGAIVFVIIGLILWAVPVIVAVVRKVPNIGSIVIIDLFLGPVMIGWVVALAMACRSRPQPQYVVPGGWGPQPPVAPPPDTPPASRY